ncbi:MAG TPA: helix-turn-helix domain-containing protein [Phormidium sp.]
MTGRIKIEISESGLELLKELKKQENQELKERIQALYWLKTAQVESTGEIASLVGKHRTTVSRWLSQYRRGGLKGLLTEGKSTGRTRKMTTEVEEKLKRELQEEEGFSSYKEVQMWLKAVEGIEMSYTRVHHLVRYKLKAKLKVPRPVHIKHVDGAVEEFKKN